MKKKERKKLRIIFGAQPTIETILNTGFISTQKKFVQKALGRISQK